MIKVSIELKDEEYANLWHAIQDLEQDNAHPLFKSAFLASYKPPQ